MSFSSQPAVMYYFAEVDTKNPALQKYVSGKERIVRDKHYLYIL
jgi:hypothetical protein